ncbi:MAG: LysM peptidoglycan-binding domain-containing protein [Nitrospirae bacterium]|nr:LysM peptidoglycan-binding domain-containing protein [Nitrospirota bacterium]
MKKTFCLFLIALLFYVPLATAEDTESEEYIIQKGDTLWDITGGKLNDPFLWPKVWSVNPQIKNPDLIYPGKKISIPLKEKLAPAAEAPEQEAPIAAKPEAHAEKSSDVKKEKPKKYIVDKNLYISSGWISNDLRNKGAIGGSPKDQTISGKNDYVYLNAKANVGDKFYIIKNIKRVKHPVTGRFIGHHLRIGGVVEVVGADSNVPKAVITTAFEELEVGDGLMPYSEIEPPLAPEKARTPDIRGHIVESHMNNHISGPAGIVYLDKGQNDGLEIGDIFSAISLADSKIEMPTGTIQVISLQSTTSAAIILKSEKEVTIGDMWGKK